MGDDESCLDTRNSARQRVPRLLAQRKDRPPALESRTRTPSSKPQMFISGPCPIMRKIRKFISDLAGTADSRINDIVRLVCHNRHHHLEPFWVILESPNAGLGGSSHRSECSRLSGSPSHGHFRSLRLVPWSMQRLCHLDGPWVWALKPEPRRGT